MLLRSLNLRRLSYVLFTGEKNHFLTQLPTIQEKLVDIFRTVSSPIVQGEMFLCIRVLLCRLSPNNLTSFWPVILTEMVGFLPLHRFINVNLLWQYRIFEQAMTNLPADGSEDLQLILSACKCLDTLLVLQTEEFQMLVLSSPTFHSFTVCHSHQCIFITDTIDAVYRPDDWFPEAMMDQLSEIAGSLPIAVSIFFDACKLLIPYFLRLLQMRTISTTILSADMTNAQCEGRCWEVCAKLRAYEI